MSNQGPEQTAIVALVPTEAASQLVELFDSANIPDATIDTYVLPTTQQEAANLAGRLAGGRVNYAAAAYVVTPHESKPLSFIKEIATGKVVEAITVENFKAAACDYYADTKNKVGAHLANKLFKPYSLRWVDPDLYRSYFEQYIIDYEPKRTTYQALRANKAGEVLARYDQGELDLRLSKRGRALLAHVCELIEDDTPETE